MKDKLLGTKNNDESLEDVEANIEQKEKELVKKLSLFEKAVEKGFTSELRAHQKLFFETLYVYRLRRA